MEISRDSYLEQLISYRWDGMVKLSPVFVVAENPIY